VAHGDRWTEAELASSVDAYLEKLALEEAGVSYSKSAIRERYLSGALSDRNKPAFEHRMRNISAVMRDLRRDWIPGYKPADHVGPAVAAVIQSCLEARWRGGSSSA
jgi:5-methylcytosine-specific restriction protein A